MEHLLSALKTRIYAKPMCSMKDVVVLSLSIVLLLIFSLVLYQGSYMWVNWKYDDTEFLSLSYNLFHGKSLTRDMIDFEARFEDTNIPELSKHMEISNPLTSKGPIFFLLLGSWLKLTNSDYSDWYLKGSILSTVLVASSLVVFYFFIKRYFGFQIAAYSTPVLVLMPGMFWLGVRIRPEVLAFIFIILAFDLALRSSERRHYWQVIMIGVLLGLAHLTHPTALAAGAGILLYLIFVKHRIKDVLLILLIWAVTISPWMVRNYILFGEPFEGLGIVIPNLFTQSLSHFPTDALLNLSGDPEAPILRSNYPLSQVISNIQSELSGFYGMAFFVFFIALSVMAYVRIDRIKHYLSTWPHSLIAIAVISGYVGLVIWTSSLHNNDNSFIIQIIVYIILPFFGTLLYGRDILSDSSDVKSLLGIYLVVGFIQYVIISFSFGNAAEVRFLFLSIFFAIPLAIIGLKNLIGYILPKHRNKAVTVHVSLFAILITYVSFQAISGVSSINSFQQSLALKDYQDDMHQWIIGNIPKDAKIATDLPHTILLKTGRQAVNFAWNQVDNIDYERWIIKRFDIDYLVFNYPAASSAGRLTYTDLHDLRLQMVFEGSNGTHIYRVDYK